MGAPLSRSPSAALRASTSVSPGMNRRAARRTKPYRGRRWARKGLVDAQRRVARSIQVTSRDTVPGSSTWARVRPALPDPTSKRGDGSLQYGCRLRKFPEPPQCLGSFLGITPVQGRGQRPSRVLQMRLTSSFHGPSLPQSRSTPLHGRGQRAGRGERQPILMMPGGRWSQKRGAQPPRIGWEIVHREKGSTS